MSNHLAIASVTATLRDLLFKAVSVDVPGANVSMLRPDGTGSGMPATGVNVFLYQVTPSAAARNEDLPTRSPDGRLVRRPRVGLDLHYLLTFFGAETELVPQRLLGSAARVLHAQPVLTRPQVTSSIAARPFLAGSNLADDVELVKFTQLPLSLEELSRLWSVFFQTRYALSVAYQGTVVLIETDAPFTSPLPVRIRNLYVQTFREPRIEAVVAAAGDDLPIRSGQAISVRGERLRGDTTKLVVGGSEVTPAGVTDGVVTASLPATLRAGLNGVQVQHFRRMGTPEADHRGVESNVAPFVLTPAIAKVGPSYDITLSAQISETVNGQVVHSADVTVEVDPEVGREQRVQLLLNELAAADPRAYTFEARPRTTDTTTMVFRARRVRPATYLVRVQVDGADSPLDVVAGSYAEPAVTL